MALDIKPTRSELINLKRRIKQTQNGYKLLKMKRDGLFHEFRTLLSEMISAKQELTGTYKLALQRMKEIGDGLLRNLKESNVKIERLKA